MENRGRRQQGFRRKRGPARRKNSPKICSISLIAAGKRSIRKCNKHLPAPELRPARALAGDGPGRFYYFFLFLGGAFLAGAVLAAFFKGAFLAGAFLAAALAGAFLAAVLIGAFLAAALTGAFLAAALTGAFLAAALTGAFLAAALTGAFLAGAGFAAGLAAGFAGFLAGAFLSLIHISEPTRLGMISY